MSLAGFVKKKKKGKKVKKFNLDGTKKKKKENKTEVVEAETEAETGGWVDDGTPLIPSYNALATKIAVVDTSTQKDKPLHENYAKDLEAEKKKMGFHATRRAFVIKGGEEKKEAEPAKPAVIPRWGAPKGRSSKLNITDTSEFPSLGGDAAVAAAVQQEQAQNPWNKTLEENAELIHMALKAEKRDFVGCTQFWGYEYGYFFKNGPEGLGYYKDPHPRDMEAPVELPEAGGPADATEEESKEAETTSRFAKKKKKKKKPKAGDAEDDEKKKDKKKKKKKKPKDGDADAAAGAEGDDSAGKDKKKKKKKKKSAAAAAAAAAAADGDAEGDAADVAEEAAVAAE